MGNGKSRNHVAFQTATIIDADGRISPINVPSTAAEIMFKKPGLVVSPASQIRRTRRIPPMRTGEELSKGKVYLLLPSSRAHREALESEMASIESASEKRRKRPKRRSSKVLPMVTEWSGYKVERPVAAVAGYGTGFPDHRLGSYTRLTPTLDPISEGI
ncbi:Nischarin like [Actinidia chinensis var. chinensis]|uniref:Nischarin like n=1 Tax=Actinidia chinensis var. chinensis TaxID=1590841 RepID=A0A2R6P5N9_ACTCC|nr:Nischarin like [Actinidia chinensis var. chinensis]